MCSTFVEHFVASRVKCLGVTVSTSFLCSSSLEPNVLPVSGPMNIQFLKKAADGGRNVEVSRALLLV